MFLVTEEPIIASYGVGLTLPLPVGLGCLPHFRVRGFAGVAPAHQRSIVLHSMENERGLLRELPHEDLGLVNAIGDDI